MNRRNFLRTVLILAMLIAATIGFGGSTLAQPAPLVVRLIINYGDGVERRFNALPWTKDMTVADLLKAAEASSHPIKVQAKGSGASYFVEKIDDLLNEGGGATKKNWQYWLNNKYASLGAGSQKLDPDDVVFWKFDIYTETAKANAAKPSAK